MFAPERMKLMFIFTSEENVSELTVNLAERRIFHLIKTDDLKILHDFHPDLSAPKLMARTNLAEADLKSVCEQLSCEIADTPIPVVTRDPEALIQEVEQELKPFRAEIEKARHQIAKCHQEAIALEEYVSLLSFWEDSKLTIEELKKLEFLALFYGFANSDDIEKLKKNLEHIPHLLYTGRVINRRVPVCIVTSKEHDNQVGEVLRSSPFIAHAIPERYTGTIYDVLEEIETDAWENREDEAEAHAKIDELKKQFAEKAHEWHSRISTVKTTATALSHYSKCGSEYVLSGWVPSSKVSEFRKLVEEKATGVTKIHEFVANEIEDAPTAPTHLSNSSLLKPFEQIVKLYGLPAYDSIDPTPFVALSFLLMFGMMFGDVGHGGVLAVLGISLTMFFKPYDKNLADIGRIISASGFAGVVFGFLFGSIFGNEELIPALWLSPTHEINTLLAAGVLIGVAVLSLGLILNIASHMMRREYKNAIFGEWGLISLLFYWTLIAIALMMLSKTSIKPGALAIGILLGIPFLALVLRDKITSVFNRCISRGKPVAEAVDDHGDSLIESGVESAVMVLEFTCNTVSYLRVASFAINHAALCAAVYLIAQAARSSISNTSEMEYSLIILGNILIIGMEGMIVFIQCLRLQFYEFFSKFFRGEGLEYSPLKISD